MKYSLILFFLWFFVISKASAGETDKVGIYYYGWYSTTSIPLKYDKIKIRNELVVKINNGFQADQLLSNLEKLNWVKDDIDAYEIDARLLMEFEDIKNIMLKMFICDLHYIYDVGENNTILRKAQISKDFRESFQVAKNLINGVNK